jgi:hypothetical protein
MDAPIHLDPSNMMLDAFVAKEHQSDGARGHPLYFYEYRMLIRGLV